MDSSSTNSNSFKRHFSTTSSSSNASGWEPFQEERIRARAVPEDTQNALANIGLRARSNVGRGYFTSVSSETNASIGSKPLFRTATSINASVEKSSSLWSRTQSAPNHFQELQPFAISDSNLDKMEEEWIQSRRKGGSDAGMILDGGSSPSSVEGDDQEGENRPLGMASPTQIKRGRDFDGNAQDVLGRWAEEDDGSIPNLSTSISSLESTSFPPDSSTPMTLDSTSRLPQRTISALPARSFNQTSSSSVLQPDSSSKLGRRPLSRPTQSMPVSSGFFVDPYSGIGSSNSNLGLDQISETAKHLEEASLAKVNRTFDFTGSKEREMKKDKGNDDDDDAQMEMDLDFQSWIKKQEGF